MAYSLSISSSQSQDAANNRSTVGATLTLTATNIGYSGYNTSWGMSIGGTGFGDAGPTALNTDGAGTETWSVGRQVTYNHNADGTRGDISCYASFNGSGGFSPPYMEAGPSTQGALNYTRTPNTPPAPTLSRDGASITMSSAGTVQAAGTGGNPPLYAAPAIDYYHWYWGTDASTPNYLAQATSPYTHTTFTKTQAVYISTYAHNSEGFGPESGSTYIAGAPNAPAAPSMTRNTNNGATITVGWSAPANNGAGIDNYHVYLRENGGTYAGPYATTGLSYTFNSLTNTSTYGAIVYAHNSSGWSDPSTESSIVGVPTQPSSITVPTPVGLATTVSWGTSTNGTISNYYVSASSDNGATWQTEIAKGTATSHPFTGLNGGANYKFRVRAQNQIGYSTYVTSGTVFVASGGKVYNGAGGAGWNAGQIARRYDSTLGWTPIVTAKRYSLSSKTYSSSSAFSIRPAILLVLDCTITPTSSTASTVSYTLSLRSTNSTTAFNSTPMPWSISVVGGSGSASGSASYNVPANSTIIIASGTFNVSSQTADTGSISASFTDSSVLGTATSSSSVVWSPWITLS